MSELKVTFVQPDGTVRTVENAKPGRSLMEVAKENDIAGLFGDCGGGCSCGTCHVYIDPAWREVVGPPNEIEDATLELVGDMRQEDSRLSCQIEMGPEMDGLKVTVAPEADF